MMTTVQTTKDVQISFVHFEKEENRAFVEALVRDYAFLFPTFLRHLTITIYDNHPDGEANTQAWYTGNWEYGQGCINIMSSILDRPLRRQHEIIVHELVHIAHMRLLSFMRKGLIKLMGQSNSDLGNYLDAESTERVEEFTEHMTRIIVDAHFEPKSVVEFRVQTEEPIDEAEEDSLGKGDLGLYPHGCSITQATEG